GISAVAGSLARPTEPLVDLLDRLDPTSTDVGYMRGQSPAHVEDVRRWLRAALLAIPPEVNAQVPAMTLIWPWLEADCLTSDIVAARGDASELLAGPLPVDEAVAAGMGWTWLAMADAGRCYPLFDETLGLVHDL